MTSEERKALLDSLKIESDTTLSESVENFDKELEQLLAELKPLLKQKPAD